MLKRRQAKEKNLEKSLRIRVTELGGLALKFVSPGFTGVPDRIVLMPGGRIWFVEVKSEGEKPKKRQPLVIRLLQRLGFSVWVIDHEETLQAFFRTIKPVEI